MCNEFRYATTIQTSRRKRKRRQTGASNTSQHDNASTASDSSTETEEIRIDRESDSSGDHSILDLSFDSIPTLIANVFTTREFPRFSDNRATPGMLARARRLRGPRVAELSDAFGSDDLFSSPLQSMACLLYTSPSPRD